MSKSRVAVIALGLSIVLLGAWLLWTNLWVNRRVLWVHRVVPQDGIADFACSADGGVVLITQDKLRYLDAAGKKQWQTPSFGTYNTDQPMHVAADQGHDRLYAVTYSGDVLAFDMTGKHLWKVAPHKDRPAGTVIDIADDGSITVSFGNHGLDVIDINGQVQNTILLEGYQGNRPAAISQTGNVYYIYAEGLVFNGQTPVYPSSKKTYRRAVDQNGSELWKHQGKYMSAYDRFHPLDADTVLLAKGSQGLTAFDASGEAIWSNDCPTLYGDNIAIDQERIYVSGYEGLRAFSHTGAKLWELEFPYWTYKPVLNDHGVLYCREEFQTSEIIAKGDTATREEWESSTEYLVAVACDTGELLWKHKWEGGGASSAKARPDGSVVIQAGGKLVCLQP